MTVIPSTLTHLGPVSILVVLSLFIIATGQRQPPRSIAIGGIFEDAYEGTELAFKHAVERMNSRRNYIRNIKLTYEINRSPSQDSYTAARRVCQQLKDGVAAIFGPMTSKSAVHVTSLCHAMQIPHVTTRWDYTDPQDTHSINLYPDYMQLSQALVDYIEYSRWESFVIIYQNDDGLARLQGLLTSPAKDPLQITVRKLDPLLPMDFRPTLKGIRPKSGVCRVILDVDYTLVREILHQAMTLNMANQDFHYLLTTLDADLVDLDDFRYSDVNITALRLIDSTRPAVEDIIEDWKFQQHFSGKSPLESRHGHGFRTEAALMYDAVHLFAKAVDELSATQSIEPQSLSCTKGKPWDQGFSVFNSTKSLTVEGLTGTIQLDKQGRRKEFSVDVTSLGISGMEKVGTWSTKDGLNIRRDVVEDKYALLLHNRTLRVTTIIEAPYMMEVEDSSGILQGNARFEGYCVDLLAAIARELHFDYEIHVVGDKKYGGREENGEWNGMVREIMDKKADLAVASLTISYVREQVIDFTKPFMNLGISILYKRPMKKNPSLYSFLAPLSFEIWVYMVAAYLTVSLLMFVLARFSPYEWDNPHPCEPDSEILENQFTLMNSLWFTIGSLMQQGCEISPKAISTRLITGFWWFFTLIMISSYTANLAAFLTVERMTSPIENADDLAKQTAIRYGTIASGSTKAFFETSSIDTYKRMWSFMSSAKPSVFVDSTVEGIARVLDKNQDYAFLLESTMNEYFTQRNCLLKQIGGLLDSKGYGIATPQGSPLRDMISNTILQLQEKQTLQRMYNKWWKEKAQGQPCDLDEGKKDASSLHIANVGGVFVLLVAGIVLSLIVGLLEFVYDAQKSARVNGDKRSVCSRMAAELKFAVRCLGPSTKPAKTAGEKVDKPEKQQMLTVVPATAYKPPLNYKISKEYYT